MSKMIQLSEIINDTVTPCSTGKFIDTTDYDQNQIGGFTLTLFEQGVRIVRVVAPDGTVELFSFAGNIVTDAGETTFLPVTDLQCQVTALNNAIYSFILSIGSGDYEIDILSIPITTEDTGDYDYGDVSIFTTGGGNRKIYYTDTFGFFPVYTDINFAGIPESYINRLYVTINCDLWKAIECIYSNYEDSFCDSCGCEDICKSKKSNNILKATMLLSELELLKDNPILYQKKLNLYSPILETLCHCS